MFEGNKILLKGGESVYLPFKFQSFETKKVQHKFLGLEIRGEEPVVGSRVLKIEILTEQKSVVLIELNVEGKVNPISNYFRFYAAEQDFIKRSINFAKGIFVSDNSQKNPFRCQNYSSAHLTKFH